jgi:hypothetical protein
VRADDEPLPRGDAEGILAAPIKPSIERLLEVVFVFFLAVSCRLQTTRSAGSQMGNGAPPAGHDRVASRGVDQVERSRDRRERVLFFDHGLDERQEHRSAVHSPNEEFH